ncbi:MAG TPA: DegV family protein [Thermoanaerobaculia bacterium]|nr:DegV family protein [Thermoanaerobaculia bacterium]
MQSQTVTTRPMPNRGQKVRYLDGRRLKRALVAGCYALLNRERALNALNVFPVADRDTGTNMACTVERIVQEIEPLDTTSLAHLMRRVADSALTGAQGNSGVILAQYFHGLAEELAPYERVTAAEFGRAAGRATRYAYAALSEPCEGTILTVLREWGTRFSDCADLDGDFVSALVDSLDCARTTVAATPQQLQVLADANVVDAAALGFLYLLEGIGRYIESGAVEPRVAGVPVQSAPIESSAASRFRYCTECMVAGDSLPRPEIEAALRGHGDSLILAGTRSRLKLHIHTDGPQAVFDLLGHYGTVSDEKADDMHSQRSVDRTTATIALVADSSCDLPRSEVERLNVHIVPIRLSFGEERLIDGISISPLEFYERLATSPVHPMTSQPPPSDFTRMFRFLSSHYRSILTVTLSSKFSGTFQCAQAMSREIPEETEIEVVNARTVSVGTGLILQELGERIQAGATFDELKALAHDLVGRGRFFVTVETMHYLIRGGRVSKLKGLLANSLRRVPILSIGSEGEVIKLTTAAKPKQFDVMWKIFLAEAKARHAYRFGIAHANAPDRAREMADRVRGEFPGASLYINDVAAVMGAHIGPGAIVMSFLGT